MSLKQLRKMQLSEPQRFQNLLESLVAQEQQNLIIEGIELSENEMTGLLLRVCEHLGFAH